MITPRAGNIGEPRRQIEAPEPIPETVPEPVQTPSEPAPAIPEKVG